MPRSYDTNTTANTIVKDLASHIAGKVVLRRPKFLILAGRSAQKLQATADSVAKAGVAYKTLELDLSSLSHVRKAAALIDDWCDLPVIDVLVNNAGVMAVDYGKTVDGYEKQFATNDLGPFLFTNLIMSKVLVSQRPRIVTDGENYDKWVAYGQSKTANMLMTVSLAQKLGPTGITAVSLHPGVIATNLGNHVDWHKDFADLDRFLGNFEGWKEGFDYKSPERGVATYVYAAFEPDLDDHNGVYLLDSHIADPTNPTETVKSWATSPVEAEMLWKLSERLVGQNFLH